MIVLRPNNSPMDADHGIYGSVAYRTEMNLNHIGSRNGTGKKEQSK